MRCPKCARSSFGGQRYDSRRDVMRETCSHCGYEQITAPADADPSRFDVLNRKPENAPHE